MDIKYFFTWRRQRAPLSWEDRMSGQPCLPPAFAPGPALLKANYYSPPAYWGNPVGYLEPDPLPYTGEGWGVLGGPAMWWAPSPYQPGFWGKWHGGWTQSALAMRCQSCQFGASEPAPPAQPAALAQAQASQSYPSQPSLWQAVAQMGGGIISPGGAQAYTPSEGISSGGGTGGICYDAYGNAVPCPPGSTASPGSPSAPPPSSGGGGGGSGSSNCHYDSFGHLICAVQA